MSAEQTAGAKALRWGVSVSSRKCVGARAEEVRGTVAGDESREVAGPVPAKHRGSDKEFGFL